MKVFGVSSGVALAAILFVGIGCEGDVDSPPPGAAPPGQQAPDPMIPDSGDGTDAPLDDAFSPDTPTPDPTIPSDDPNAGVELIPESTPAESEPSGALELPGDDATPASPDDP